MKPWEVKSTKRKIKNLSGEKTLRIFFDLYQAGLEVLRSSLRAEKPHLSSKQLKLERDKLRGSLGQL